MLDHKLRDIRIFIEKEIDTCLLLQWHRENVKYDKKKESYSTLYFSSSSRIIMIFF